MTFLRQRAQAVIAFAKRRMTLATAYQRLWENEDGRVVFEDILREGGLLSVSHVENDPTTSSFNEGRRSLALHVVERLRWSEGELVALARRQTSDQLEQEEG